MIIEEKSNNDVVSLWVKDKDVFVPSTDISLYDNLPPGLYKVSYNNDNGLHCKNISLETDELYEFSDSITKSLLKEVSDFWNKKELYKKENLMYKRGILLVGKAGTGKTSYINMLSKELINKGGIVFKLEGIRNYTNYVEFIKHGFRKIEKDTPIITIIEDIDQYMEIESDILDFLDGQYHLSNHVVLATSNNTQNLSNTILRPSRLDLLIEVPIPSDKTRKEYFEKKLNNLDLIEELVSKTKNMTFAEMKEIYICLNIFNYTIEDAIKRVKNKPKKNYLTESNNIKI